MAIYSLNHKTIGKKTHRAGQASAHLRYISRGSAAPKILSNGIPSESGKAQRWLKEQENRDRSNARIIDKLMVAIPIELNKEERKILIQDFLQEITGDLVPWYAAIHQTGKDSHNPHAHIIIRDRSLLDGRRVVQTSERGSTKHFRKKWTEEANKALLRTNNPETIDDRSLKEQGIEREPTRHRGWEKKELERVSKNWVERMKKESGVKNYVSHVSL